MERWDSRTRPTDSTAGAGSSGTVGGESVPSAGLVREVQGMRQQEPGRSDPSRPRDWFKSPPFEPAAASDRLGWVGLEAAHYCEVPDFEFNQPALTHHLLVLYIRPPE